MEYETLLEIITARDVRRAHAFRQQTVEEGADFDELFTGIDNTARKRDFGGTLVSITSTSFLILFLISFPFMALLLLFVGEGKNAEGLTNLKS